MFKKSDTFPQLNLFGFTSQLDSASYKTYSDDNGWHNIFRHNVLNQIDEGVFSVLYDPKMGAANASVRTIIGMMILKDGRGWSDKDLYEQCRFNILVKSALGINDLQTIVPSESSYYLFKDRVYKFEVEMGTNLIEKCFCGITSAQIKEFEVSGKSARMDSTLIGSNIANQTRYTVIQKTLQGFLINLLKTVNVKDDSERESYEAIVNEDAQKTVYTSPQKAINEKINKLGELLNKIVNYPDYKYVEGYSLVSRVFSEHYHVETSRVVLKTKEDLLSGSLQSPYDQDAAYRNKDGEEVRGYSANITETCNDDGLNLITFPEVKPANVADKDFVISSIESTNDVLEDEVDNLHTDGAYSSEDNRDYFDKQGITHYATAMAGKTGDYEFDVEGDVVVVTQTSTGEQQKVEETKSGKSYKAEFNGQKRYFKAKQIANSLRRKLLEELPAEIRNILNNVEATIYHVVADLRNKKVRYRGLIKTKIWLLMRCLWINTVRIKNYMGEACLPTT